MYERNQFVAKAKQKLAYYDTAILIVNDDVWSNKIYRSDSYQISQFKPFNEMHLCLKDVVYQIDWNALGINRIDVPIALRFSLEDGLRPTPSRESYITNSTTKEIILKKLREACTHIITEYNIVIQELQ